MLISALRPEADVMADLLGVDLWESAFGQKRSLRKPR